MKEYVIEFISVGGLVLKEDKNYVQPIAELMYLAIECDVLQFFDFYTSAEADEAVNDYPETIKVDTTILRVRMGVHEEDVDVQDQEAFKQYIIKALQERPTTSEWTAINTDIANDYKRQIISLSLWHPDTAEFNVQDLINTF